MITHRSGKIKGVGDFPFLDPRIFDLSFLLSDLADLKQ